MKPPSGYKRFLLKNETVNGKLTEFVCHIKNIGDKSVPRGHVKIVLKTPFGMGELTHTRGVIEMAALEPNKTFSLESTIGLTAPGLWYMILEVELAEKEEKKKKVEYYQFEGGTPTFEHWIYPFYAVDRHQLGLISRLEKLMKKKVQ